MITPAQCRAARGLLDWSQQQLAEAARVGIVTVRQFEAGGSPRNATLDVVTRALESAGVIFVPGNGEGPGVRLRKDAQTDLNTPIETLKANLPDVDASAPPSPAKAMRQLERAHGKNEIAKAKGKRAKLKRN